MFNLKKSIKMKNYKFFTNHIVIIEDSGSVTVYQKCKNASEGFRKLCDAQGISYDKTWTTRQFGAKISEALGRTKEANYYLRVGDYGFGADEKGSYFVFEAAPSAIAALRAIADEVGFKYEDGWNTRTFGSKLVNLK